MSLRNISPILVCLLFCLPALGARTIIAPQFYFHDWWNLLAPWDTTNRTYRCIDISVTNLSEIVPQTVTVTGQSVNDFWDTNSRANPGAKLSIMEFRGEGLTLSVTPGGATQRIDAVRSIPPAATRRYSFCAAFANNGLVGDWHLVGAIDLRFSVLEDRGAVTAVMNTRVETTHPLDTSNSVSAMRNASRTMVINGGKPF